MWKSFLARKKGKQHTTKMASSWRISFLIIWLVTNHAMGFPWLLPLLSSTRTCLHCRLAFTQHTLHLHSRPTPNQHAPMSPLLTSTHLAHTHSSIAHQHPPNAHTCLHLWPARTHVSTAYQRPPSPYTCLHLWPARTHASIAGQHPPSAHPCLHLWPASTHQRPPRPLLCFSRPWVVHA